MGNLEVFGFALHLFVKATGLCSDRLLLVQCCVICVQNICAFGILSIQLVGVIWCHMQQRVNFQHKIKHVLAEHVDIQKVFGNLVFIL